jgi:hypothetical protein
MTTLIGTNFVGADLTGVNFAGAEFCLTVFGNTDLSEAAGLSECFHGGWSILDHATIAKSAPLPVSFLRGCGLTDNLISFLPWLVNDAIQFYLCFISYASQDQSFAERLNADLRAKHLRCWFAPEDLKIGDRFQESIEESIRLFDKVMIVLSENSMKSRLMETPQPWAADIRGSRHIGDFSRWKDHDSYQKTFERLLRDLRADEAKAQRA